jgi:hypothetical protein
MGRSRSRSRSPLPVPIQSHPQYPQYQIHLQDQKRIRYPIKWNK